MRRLLFLITITLSLPAITPDQKQFLGQFIKPGNLVFDVGALVGKKADLYLDCGAHVICIEPQDIACMKLHQKYKNNPRITIIETGLADSEGIREFAIATTGRALSTFSHEWRARGRYSAKGKDSITGKWDQLIAMPVTTLDILIARYGLPQFCKIDVENFEFEVLSGLSQPIPSLCFEFHIEMFHNVKKCITHLESLGYRQFNFTTADQFHFSIPDWVDGTELLKHIVKERKSFSNPDLLWGDVYAQYVT